MHELLERKPGWWERALRASIQRTSSNSRPMQVYEARFERDCAQVRTFQGAYGAQGRVLARRRSMRTTARSSEGNAVRHPPHAVARYIAPALGGYETVACIRCAEADESVKLVALTAHNSNADRALTSSVGFDLHVQKPIGSKQLVKLAELACPRR